MRFDPKEHMTFEVPSSLEEIPRATERVFDFLKHISFSESDHFDIRLSFEEVLINGMKHGNGLKKDIPVKVTVAYNDQAVSIAVKDQGPGFDIDQIKDPTDDANIEAYSGRGIFLVKHLMDHLECDIKGDGTFFVKVYQDKK